MIPNIKVNKFLNSRTLASTIFIGSGGYKLYHDYKGTNKNYREKFLIKDGVILYGAASGILLSYGLGNRIAKTEIYQKIINNLSKTINKSTRNKNLQTSINYTKDILKEVFAGLSSATAGIIGALGADWLLSKTKFEQPEEENKLNLTKDITKELKLKKLEDKINAKLENITDEDTLDIFYSSMLEMPKLKYAGAGMVGIDALEIAENKKFEDKLKHTTGYLINDTLVPLLFLSTATALTQKIKTKYRIPIIFSTLFGGTLITHKIFDKFAKHNTNN